MSPYLPLPGTPVSELDTPALLIDLDKIDGNIAKMAAFFQGRKAQLRPHTKTHKSPVLAWKQIKAGAKGVTCAKLSEAEVMVAAGIPDILIANEIVGAAKIARLVNLARHANIMVALDNPRNAQDLCQSAQEAGITLSVLIEVNIGMNRCGVQPGEPALQMARFVQQCKGLKFRGIQAYEGHLVMMPDLAQREQQCRAAVKLATDTRKLIEDAGIPVEIVSGGGTGTYNITGACEGVDEIQAGSYITMDARYRGVGAPFENALTLLTTVVSRPTADIAVTDAGMKSLTHEFGMPEPQWPGVTLTGLSEEHGKLAVSADAPMLRAGDKIEIIPSHGCTTINLHDNYYAVRHGKLEAVWPIAARGCSQ